MRLNLPGRCSATRKFPDSLFFVLVAISVANSRFQFISVAISIATWSIIDRNFEEKQKKPSVHTCKNACVDVLFIDQGDTRTMKDLTSSLYKFEDLINGNYLYVDKTEFIWSLVKPYKGIYFMARPRRFGKSLTLSTLKAVFQGRKDLFQGLAIYDKPYDWTQ